MYVFVLDYLYHECQNVKRDTTFGRKEKVSFYVCTYVRLTVLLFSECTVVTSCTCTK